MTLAHLSDTELMSATARLAGSHRAITAQLVLHLAEIEDRRLHLREAYSSLFDFCTTALKMGEGEAYRRIVAARLARRYPTISGLIESGALHLSALTILRHHLTDENHGELLQAASGKSKKEVEELVAARFPKPDVPDLIRKLPERPPASEPPRRSAATLSPAPLPRTTVSPVPLSPTPPAPASLSLDSLYGISIPTPARGDRPGDRPPIAPLSEGRYKIQFTASAALREKLERARDLLSHADPGRDLAGLVERAVDLLLEDLERKKRGKTSRPRRKGRPAKPERISTPVRREVFARDGEQCTFEERGKRCDARAFLELDHKTPRALGGASDARSVRVYCRAHNLLAAEDAFGKEHIARSIHFRQRKYEAGAMSGPVDTSAQAFSGPVGLRAGVQAGGNAPRAPADPDRVERISPDLEALIREGFRRLAESGAGRPS